MTSVINLPERLLLSQEIEELTISSDLESINLSISLSVAGGPASVIYSQRLFTYSGKVSVRIRDLMEIPVQSRAISRGTPEIWTLRVRVAEPEAPILNPDLVDISRRFIWCSAFMQGMPASEWLSHSFLDNGGARRAPQSAPLTAFALIPAGEAVTPSVAVTVRDRQSGDVSAVRYDMEAIEAQESEMIRSFRQSQAQLRDAVSDASHDNPDSFDIISASLNVGKRSMTIFFDPQLSNDRSFSYLDAFAIRRSFYILATVKKEFKLTAGSAVSSGRRISYDRRIDTIFVSTTLPALPGEDLDLRDLLISPYVAVPYMLYEDGAQSQEERQVIISEAEAVSDEADEAPPVFRITWRNDRETPEFSAVSPYSRFTDPFDNSFF